MSALNHRPFFLLVEDDPVDVNVVAGAFERAGMAGCLRVVRDGLEARRYLRREDEFAAHGHFPMPRVILLDLGLPLSSGLELLGWLRRDAPPQLRSILVVIVSLSDRESDIKRAYSLGANHYFRKPIDWRQFAERMKALKVPWPARC